MPKDKILFLTLKIFSSTGGIEKVCKVAGKILYETWNDKIKIHSVYDNQKDLDIKYFPASIFSGFNGVKWKSIYRGIKAGKKSKVVILSHVNLLPVAFLIRKFSPSTKFILLAHGIEVWRILSGRELKMLKSIDQIIAVSNYTKQKMESIYNLNSTKILVVNNCIDPFLSNAVTKDQLLYLYKKYNLSKANFTLITVTRIASDEQYKGYDKVIESINNIIGDFPNLRYLIVGKYDQFEKERLNQLIDKYNLKDIIIFTGFVADKKLPSHYKLADLYIMPSKGEGFGIVFIEAMYFGLPVIAGNKDGSLDPLMNGELGLLVDPDNVEEISNAIKKVIQDSISYKPEYSKLVKNFGYETYKKNLKSAIGILYS